MSKEGCPNYALPGHLALVATGAERFRREIEAGHLKILNVAVAAVEEELPFWVCLTDDRLSALRSADASSRSHAVREIRVPCRKFRSILEEHGMPFYMKIDIQGNDRLCVEALDGGELPKFLSVEFVLSDTPLVALLRERGFGQFKCVSQTHFLPLVLPPIAEARLIQHVERLNRSRNIMARVFRRLGGRRLFRWQFDCTRTHDRWVFPAGSSGPFGDALRGRWLTYDELLTVTGEFLRLRQEAPQTLQWAFIRTRLQSLLGRFARSIQLKNFGHGQRTLNQVAVTDRGLSLSPIAILSTRPSVMGPVMSSLPE